jgi:hypothetical protein
MDELLRKLAVEGWWAWVILLAVVTIVYIGRHRTGLASLLQPWETWGSPEALKPYLIEGETVRLLEGPLAVTDKRVLVHKTGIGSAFAAGTLDSLCNIEYGQPNSLIPLISGIVYLVLGAAAIILSGGLLSMILVGALIVLVGLAVSFIPLRSRGSVVLVIAFHSGRPIVLTSKLSDERLQSLSREIMHLALERRRT